MGGVQWLLAYFVFLLLLALAHDGARWLGKRYRWLAIAGNALFGAIVFGVALALIAGMVMAVVDLFTSSPPS